MEYISEEKLKTVSKSIWSFLLAGMLLLVGFAVAGEHFYSSLADTAGNSVSVQVNQANAETVFSDPSQYSSITLTDDIDMSEITLEGKPNSSSNFTGVLDGTGFSISNLSFAGVDGSNNFGLIPAANGATIQNLRISGSVSFNFSQTDNSIVNVGLLVGRARGTTISNCEIDVDGVQLDFSYNSANVGLLAGNVESCQFYDIVTKSDLTLSLSTDTQYNVGGLVGAFSSSEIRRVLFFGEITINSSASEQSFDSVFAGGLLGFAQGDSQIRDNGVSATLTSEFATRGGLVGQISSNSSVATNNLNYCYWVDASLSAVGSNGEQYLQTQTLTSTLGLSYSFLSNKENFDPTSAGFDFDLVFGTANTEIVLQRFQNFTFSFDDALNDYIERAVFVVGAEEEQGPLTDIAYDTPVGIRLYLNSQLGSGVSVENLVDFLDLRQITVNNVVVDLDNYQISSDSLNNCFDISFAANGLSTGSYHFGISAESYQCEFVAARDGDILPGGVTISGASVESLTQTLSVESEQTSISAEPTGYYVFDHWNLYYFDENETWVEQSGWENEDLGVVSTLARLPIRFGVAPFDQVFRLEAVFSSENGVSVDFANFDDERIASVYVQGNLYSNQPITILRTLTNASMVITMQEGYEFDSQAFVSSLRTLYNQNVSVDEVVSHSQNTQGQNVYNLTIDIARICENGASESINFSLPTIVQDDGSGDGLLWLWITLPCVLVVAGVATFLIIYLRKRNQARSNVKKREKEINYKDFYM